MLDRHARPAGARSRARRAARDRRHRANAKAGIITVGVPVDAAVIELLIATRWLREADAADRVRVGEAIARLLADAARRR